METEQTFLNGLVYLLTFGVCLAMAIKVTCAVRTSANARPVLRAGSEDNAPAEFLQRATELVRDLGTRVTVEFR